MAKYQGTKFKGVRAREHATRKHGIKPDLYFFIRYQFDGERKEEGLGWASEGWSAEKAALKLAELKTAAKIGQGESRLSEKREAKKQADRLIRVKKEEQEKKAVTYAQYFVDHYLHDVEQSKTSIALKPEKSLHENWILPAIGKVHVFDIGELHIKKVSLLMKKAGRAPRTIQYAHAAIRMVLNHAKKTGYYHNENPVKHLSKSDKPKFDNKRLRFFSHSEAEDLLSALYEKSKDLHDMTMLSLHCGLRAGEIFSLTWQNIDLKHKLISVTRTKSGKDRTVPMTEAVYEMFNARNLKNKNELVFPDKKGGKRKQISNTFERIVEELGFNENTAGRKDKLVFHSCRHSCASWLVQAGVPLLTVKEILGHSTIAMTERYSHLAPDGTRAAIAAMEQAITESRSTHEKTKVISINGHN
jgi:integrase